MIAPVTTELATEQNFDEARYLAVNADVARHVAAGGDARRHFLDHGRREGRRQQRAEVAASLCAAALDREAFLLPALTRAGLEPVDPSTAFPLAQHGLSSTMGVANAIIAAPGTFVTALHAAPNARFAWLGGGRRAIRYRNCLYVDDRWFQTTDVIAARGTPLPFDAAALDGLCISDWDAPAGEFARVTKPGAPLFVTGELNQVPEGFALKPTTDAFHDTAVYRRSER